MCIVSRLTKHFIRRWEQRRGGFPTVVGVNDILKRSQRVRGQHVFWKLVNVEFYQASSPAIFWSHKDGLIIMVDLKKGAAITLIVPADK